MIEGFEGTGLRRWLLQHGFPFMLISKGQYMPNWTRIIEALFIAGITSMVTAYITLAKLEVKIDYAKEDRARIERRVDKVEECLIRLMEKIASEGRKR